MTSTEIGKRAELAASNYLEMRGFHIVERNWRRPNCEIDIIASKDGVLQFVEVKHRATDDQGGGLEAITASKLKKMRNAAWSYVTESKWNGEYLLSAVETSGPDFTVMAFIENVF